MSRGREAKSGVRDELWHSFASMLRSYAAAASIHGISHGVLVLSKDALHIVAGRDTLKISYHPTLGRGLWSLHEGTDRHDFAVQPRELDRGDFDVNLDGTIHLHGESIAMDHAAIQLIGALSTAASRAGIHQEIEVLA